VPKRQGGDSFSSNNPGKGQPVPEPLDPASGRQNNQGFEGLSLSPDGKKLFTLLQSATRQDGGKKRGGTSRRYSRLLVYDVTGEKPSLAGEYVVPLPVTTENGEPSVNAQSELLALNDTQFLMLARDAGHGRGGKDTTSRFRNIMLVDTAAATNLAGSAFDQPENSVAPGGTLSDTVTPASVAPFIDMNDPAELAKFGLTNGPKDSPANLSEKWEALALVPTLDEKHPNAWFLFVGNDNDFITSHGRQDEKDFDAGLENDTRVLVYQITLPFSRPGWTSN
jgi:hypothetical protein